MASPIFPLTQLAIWQVAFAVAGVFGLTILGMRATKDAGEIPGCNAPRAESVEFATVVPCAEFGATEAG